MHLSSETSLLRIAKIISPDSRTVCLFFFLVLFTCDSLIGGYIDALGHITSHPANTVTVVFCGLHKYQLQKDWKKKKKKKQLEANRVTLWGP